MNEYKKVRLGDYIKEYSVKNKTNENIPVYSVTNSSGFCTEYFSKEVASKDKSTYKIVPKGYFAYNPSRINVGSVDWQRTEERVIVSPLYNVFSISDDFDNQFLYYYLKSDYAHTYIVGKADGSVRDNLKLSQLAEFQIPLPPLQTQQKISAILDKVQKIINNHKAMLEKYDLLIKSRFVEMFGDEPVENGKWKVEKLGDLVTVTSSKRIYAEEQSTAGIPFLRISDLVSKINGVDSNDLYIPEEKYHEFVQNGLVPNVDDILVTSRGTLGLCYTITADDKFYFQDGMITWLKFSNHDSILSIFLSYHFNVILKQKIDLKTNGATVKYVSISELKNLKIPVPPLALQNQFATFVQQIDKAKANVQKSLEKCETLYKSLMQKYFG